MDSGKAVKRWKSQVHSYKQLKIKIQGLVAMIERLSSMSYPSLYGGRISKKIKKNSKYPDPANVTIQIIS